MKNFIYVLLLSCSCLLFACQGGVKTSDKKTITVSIAPLKAVVEAVAGDDFEIVVLVPQGSSPETYSPTPRQLATVDNSLLFAYLGTLQFENELVTRLEKSKGQFVNLSDNVALLPESHSHDHMDGEEPEYVEHNSIDAHHSHNHNDPHIWLSPRNLAHIAENFNRALSVKYPDSVKYNNNTLEFIDLMTEKEAEYKKILSTTPSRAFLIYHPALSYLADEYGLEQLAVEQDGKDPTPSSVAAIIDQAHAKNVDYIMYQSEFSSSAIRSIIEETGIKAIAINPLSPDVVDELDRIINIVSTGGDEY